MQPIESNNEGIASSRNADAEGRAPGKLDMREIVRTVIRAELRGQRLSRLQRREIRRFAQGYGLSEREVSDLLGESKPGASSNPEGLITPTRASVWGWGFVVLGVAGLLQALWLLVSGTL